MANLVTQVLEPTIGNYFRNAAQSSDVIDFLKGRQQRQEDAKQKSGAALGEYNVGAVDTLIGDITPPDALMKTLTDRKLAEQEKVTYDTQRLAEETRKDLEQAKALATTQARVVDAERSVTIAEFNAKATGYFDAKLLGCCIRCDAGEIIAGVEGYTSGRCCELAHVWSVRVGSPWATTPYLLVRAPTLCDL